jgi:tetratricopeptide (TPR) repeat protein
MVVDSEAQDWAGVLSQEKAMQALFPTFPGARYYAIQATPLAAVAEAELGHFAQAEVHLAPTASDCYDCLMARAKIAEMQSQRARADWWFDRATTSNPSIPFAYAEWGAALLARGDLAGAIAKFKLANQKGPHFADPLEGWGEALMAQNRSDLALAKFAEAEKYAPNWGRLHLKWGEALNFAGKKDEAQKQYALAAGLDLTAAEKSELAKVKLGRV